MLEQIAAVLAAPFAPLRLRRRGLVLTLLYTLAAGTVLFALAWLLIRHKGAIQQLLAAYLLPESWRFAAGLLIDHLLASQAKAVLINAVVSGTMVLISILLFPLKEKLSATFEAEGQLTSADAEEFPLWFQAYEEFKLLLLYVTAQGTIFWIGYHPDPTRKTLAIALSFLFLVMTFSIDFIAPLLQRHRVRYGQILKLLLRQPVILLGFGALLAAPAVLAGFYVKGHPALSLQQGISILFGANLISIVWAVLAGTWVASKLLDAGKTTPASALLTRLLAWALLLALFAANAYTFSSVGRSLHHKSQILKCNYDVVPSTLSFQRPSLGALLRGKVSLGVSFELEIENPTAFDVSIEKNRLEVTHEETLVATSKLAPLAIPSGKKRRQKLDLQLALSASALRKGRALLKDRWSITLYLQVADKFEFPIYLRHTFAKAVKAKKR